LVAESLAAIRAVPGHQFWGDTISIVDAEHVNVAHLSHHGRVTDTYLLALAKAHGGMLASMDHRLAIEAVDGGGTALELI
jgi:predicted nucleic acid-binding protein